MRFLKQILKHATHAEYCMSGKSLSLTRNLKKNQCFDGIIIYQTLNFIFSVIEYVWYIYIVYFQIQKHSYWFDLFMVPRNITLRILLSNVHRAMSLRDIYYAMSLCDIYYSKLLRVI